MAVQSRLIDSAVSASYAWQNKGSMPVVKWDDYFEKLLDERIELADAYKDRGICILPWRILECLPRTYKISERLYWSQGNLGSCMSHANTFAFQCATLIEIAFGAPLRYHSLNPIISFWLSKGKSLRGGQTVSDMSDWTNRFGQYPEDEVGEDNLSIPDDWEKYQKEALEYQTGLVFLEKDDPDEIATSIIRACHAGFAFAYGNTHAVTGCKIDKNGVKVAVLGGSWAHATSISSYRKIGSTEYVFWQNSHGPIYDCSDEGEPADGCWMDTETLTRFCRSISDYGHPYITLPEGDISEVRQLMPVFNIPFPSNWIDK